MQDSFDRVFSVLTKERFLEDPRIILSYMRDVGFPRPLINMVSSVIDFERRRFILAMTCPEDELKGIVGTIATNCMFDETRLEDAIPSGRMPTRIPLDGPHEPLPNSY